MKIIRNSILIAMVLLFTGGMRICYAVDFMFEPDTVGGNIGETVWLSGRIGPSEAMRSFTIYLSYDTTFLRLNGAPVAGALVENKTGLDFRYLDHVPSEPDWLEIGATVFSADFWSGPGELFRIPFLLRACGDVPITAPFGIVFRNSSDQYVTGIYHNATVLICDRIPQAVNNLTIYPLSSDSVMLRWSPVTKDTLNRLLISPPSYSIFRQRIAPTYFPPESLTTVTNTFCGSSTTGNAYLYYLMVRP